MTRMVRVVTSLALALLGACGPVSSGAPVEVCTEVGQRCRLAEGVLGVCTATEAESCDAPPCLRCFDQH